MNNWITRIKIASIFAWSLAWTMMAFTVNTSFASCTHHSNSDQIQTNSNVCQCPEPPKPTCCDSLGISYCDTSAGHYVCNSGGYSQCICTATAISNLQGVTGCCTWHGGVFTVNFGEVICSDGTISAVCSIQNIWTQNNNY